MANRLVVAFNVFERAVHHAQKKLVERHFVSNVVGDRIVIIDFFLNVQISLLQFQNAFEVQIEFDDAIIVRADFEIFHPPARLSGGVLNVDFIFAEQIAAAEAFFDISRKSVIVGRPPRLREASERRALNRLICSECRSSTAAPARSESAD